MKPYEQRRIFERLEREADRMERQCAEPPCVHAQGVRLAQSWVEDEARELVWKQHRANFERFEITSRDRRYPWPRFGLFWPWTRKARQ